MSIKGMYYQLAYEMDFALFISFFAAIASIYCIKEQRLTQNKYILQLFLQDILSKTKIFCKFALDKSGMMITHIK